MKSLSGDKAEHKEGKRLHKPSEFILSSLKPSKEFLLYLFNQQLLSNRKCKLGVTLHFHTATDLVAGFDQTPVSSTPTLSVDHFG